ncbi:hypothetical protein PTKU46_95100 [Paraburkholderia terrae]
MQANECDHCNQAAGDARHNQGPYVIEQRRKQRRADRRGDAILSTRGRRENRLEDKGRT